MANKPTSFQRFIWHPLVVTVPLVYFIAMGVDQGFTLVRAVGLLMVSLWFMLAVINRMVGNRFVSWLYSEEE